ncbi:unnamed protein product, partial [Soboliphyme baturini]|uniref:Hemocyanin_N domain-containing protein n=1 Tax=Soboliphyme baturini TaxID=241478 RepID=A0A183IAP4_9BILA
MVNFVRCCCETDVDVKSESLKNLYNGALCNEPLFNREQHFFREYYDLLARHMQIEVADGKRFALKKEVAAPPMEDFLLDKPLLSTLHYCCLYHYHDPMV